VVVEDMRFSGSDDKCLTEGGGYAETGSQRPGGVSVDIAVPSVLGSCAQHVQFDLVAQCCQ
jgi:hypothetical protein